LGFNKLTELPVEIGYLNFLTTLELRDNPSLHVLPPLANLRNLQTLNIRNLQVNSLPSDLAKLVGLTELDLRDNAQFKELPREIGFFEKSQEIRSFWK